MSWTRADLDSLEAAVARGVLTCEVNGRRVTYQTTTDLLRARREVQLALSADTSGSTLSPRYRVASFNDG